MTLVYTYDGAVVTHNIAPSTVSLVSAAELGESSMSGLQIEDPGSTLTMLGHRPFVVEESACSQPRLFTGWTTARGVGRSVEDGMFGNSTAGVHDVTVIDLNALFNWRTITGTDGNRPAETFAARLAWILGSDYLTGLIEDTGYIVVNTTAMDAADYRDGYPSAVLDDLMDRSGSAYNYFAFWDATAAAVGLWVGHLDTAVSDSTLRISNVAADVDGTTTFPPDDDARLAITPTETFSEVTVEYAHGTKRLFRSRASTAAKYIQRGTKIQRPYTGQASTASTQAERFLDQHANEEDRITVTIIVPAAKAGLLTAGQRLDVKFSHLTGYTTFTSMRCVRLTVTPTNDHATHYSLALELAATRPITGALGGTSGLVQSVTTQNTNANATITATLPAAPTAGNVLVACYSIRGTSVCSTPAGWTRGPDFNSPTFDGGNATLFHRTVPVGGSASLTITKNTGDYAGLTLVEMTGVGAFDTSGYANMVAASSSLSAGPLAATTGPIAVFAAFVQSARSGVPFTFGSGYTLLGEVQVFTSGPAVAFGWRYVAWAAGTQTATATSSESDGYGWAMLSFIAVADTEISLPPPPAVTAVIDQINNLSTVAASGATETLDASVARTHDVTLTADCTFTFAGAVTAEAWFFTLILRQNGTGGWTSTWPGSVVWPGGVAPTLDETASTVEVLTFFTLDGGTVWYGFLAGGSGVAGGTPALTLGTTNSAGVATTAVLTDATVAVFDATVPTTAAFSDAAATGAAAFAARRDHRHGMPATPASGGVGAILISDTPSTPLVFADLVQNEAADDLVYADI